LLPAALAGFTGKPQMLGRPAAEVAVIGAARALGNHAAVAVTTAAPAV